MKKLILITSLLLILTSCGQDYTYNYQIYIEYIGGGSDTVHVQYSSFNGNDVYLRLNANHYSPTLTVMCGLRGEIIATDVRRYKILSKTKTPLKTKICK